MLTSPAGTLDVLVADRQRTGRLDHERGGAGRGRGGGSGADVAAGVGADGPTRGDRAGRGRRRSGECGQGTAVAAGGGEGGGRARRRHRRVRDRRHSRGRDRPRRPDAVGSSGMTPAPVGCARTGCGGGGGGRARGGGALPAEAGLAERDAAARKVTPRRDHVDARERWCADFSGGRSDCARRRSDLASSPPDDRDT